MKLSKKNAARQRALQKAIASGKALGGLLVGFAATVVGCGERYSPAHTMGRFPDPHYQENAKNENIEEFVIEGEIQEPGEIPAQGQGPSETNAVREAQGKGPVLLGEPMPLPGKLPVPPPQPNAVNGGRSKTRSAKGRFPSKK